MFTKKILVFTIMGLILSACQINPQEETNITHEDTREFSGIKDNSSSVIYVSNQELSLTSHAGTDQWEKIDSSSQYTYPVNGNFIAEVIVRFSPNAHVQHAGIGIGSIDDPFTWVRITRTAHPFLDGYQGIYVMANNSGESVRLNKGIYTNSTTFLRIERRDDSFTLSYSADNQNWTILQSSYHFPLPEDVKAFLLVYSTNPDEGATARFENFRITPLP